MSYEIFLLRRVWAVGVQRDSDGPLAQRVSNGAIGWFGWAARSVSLVVAPPNQSIFFFISKVPAESLP